MTLSNKLTVTLAAIGLLLCTACSSTKKAERYEMVYNEAPQVIYIAPVIDLTPRRPNHNPTDSAYNRETSTAAYYLYQAMAEPLNRKGYYTISPFSSREIVRQESRTTTELKNGDLSAYATRYGADAVLFATIHRWYDQPGVWTVYVDFALRSTRTGSMIAHTAVKAAKEVPYTITGKQVNLIDDSRFAENMGTDNGTTQRCILLEQTAGFVLRDYPVARDRRQFNRDKYDGALPDYIRLTINDEGRYQMELSSMEEFESGTILLDNGAEEQSIFKRLFNKN